MFLGALPAAAQDWTPYTGTPGRATHALSPEVRSLPDAPGNVGAVTQIPLLHRPSFVPPGPQPSADQALQTTTGASIAASSGIGFGGVSFNGYYPPDPNVSVGDTQIVQTTNVQFAVYDKSGTLLKGPVNLDTLFGALGGQCATTNGGDPIVLWDKVAHRWLISQLAFNSSFTQNSVCIAVSTSSDATGSFNEYGIPFSHLPDYPKFGIWASSTSGGSTDYYFSANLFSTALYYGPVVCAFNGGDMQSGATLRYNCVQGKTSDFSLLPSGFDGATPPATGEANYFVEMGTGGTATSGQTLIMYPFRATWTSSSGSLNNPSATTINVNPYTTACSGGGTCIPQPGTTQQVDSLGDRLMYRLSYRNFGTYESLLVNHSVDEGNGVVGIRWYELRSNSGSTLANGVNVSQQGTFSGADANYRWMGSIAQDKAGNIALGYSTSNGSNLYPSIAYTGRVPSDTPGTMESENIILYGTGSETGGHRWGDYSSLALDPADDCTFWYTNEYYLPSAASGIAWNTQIASFKFSTCGQTQTTSTTTAVTSSLNPSIYGSNVTFTATVAPSAATGTVQFFDGATSLGVVAVSGGTALLSTSALAVGSHSITASYSGDSNFTGSTSPVLTQTVNTATTGSFSLSSSPTSAAVRQGGSAQYVITVSSSSGFSGNVSLSVSGVPSQSTASFSLNPVTGGSGSSTLTVKVGAHTKKKTYTLTVTGTAAGGLTATTSVTLTVQ